MAGPVCQSRGAQTHTDRLVVVTQFQGPAKGTERDL